MSASADYDLSAKFWIFTSMGIWASCSQVILTVYILQLYVFKSKPSKLEYKLILFRVLLDALNGASSVIFFSSSIPILVYNLSYDFSFVMGLIGANFLEMRSFLAAIIAIERALAATFPLSFYKWRSRISNWPIFIFTVSTGISMLIFLFGVCDAQFPLATGCNSVTCAVPTCYVTYGAATRVVYSSTNALFSGVLCFKLFKLSVSAKNTSKDFRKANWLSLTDGMSTLIFDLLPAVLFNRGIIVITSHNPFMSSLRQTGRALEAAVMVILMKKRSVVSTRTNGGVTG